MRRMMLNAAQSLWIAIFCSLALLAPAEEISFDLGEGGNLSAAIYDAEGRLVRELLRAEPYERGAHRLSWDRLDQAGAPVPAGTYEWRLLQTRGLRSEYIMSVGTSVGKRWWPGNHDGPQVVTVAEDSLIVGANPEGPPLLTRSTLDGQVIWERKQFEPARSPYDVAAANDRVYYLQDNGKVFVLSFATGEPVAAPLPALFPVKRFDFAQLPLTTFNEAQGYGWETIEGMEQRQAGIVSTSPEARTFTATLPDGVYLLRFSQGHVDRATTVTEVHPGGMKPYPGHYTLADKMAWWQLPASPAGTAPAPFYLPQLYGLPRPVVVKDGRLTITFTPGNPRQQPAEALWQLSAVEVIAMADRITANDDHLVLSSKSAGKVMWIDPADGSIIDEAALPGVLDVALDGTGHLFALLPDRVVSVSRERKQPQLRASGLRNPVALDVDRRTGGMLVAEGGRIQQVKRFAPDGKLEATLGREGGRQLGAYQPADFGDLAGIAADGNGGFVAIERRTVPRRTVHINASGDIQREWFGGMDFYTQTEIDPADPTIAWIRQDDTHLIRAKLDYEAGEWRPLSTYRWTEMWDPTGPGGIFSHGPWLQRNPTFNRMRTLRRDLTGNGRTHLLIEFTALPMLLVHDEETDRLRPLAALGMLGRDYWAAGTDKPVDELPAAWVEAIRLAGGDPANAAGRRAFARYAWADENGDGLIDANELRLAEAHRDASSPTQGNGGFCLHIDAELNAWVGNGDTRSGGLYRIFRPERFTAAGAPVWPLQPVMMGPTTEARGASTALVTAPDGGAFVVVHGAGDGTRASFTYDTAVHGWSWPSVMTDGVALMRLDADGQPRWRTSSKAARWPHPRGQLHGPWHLGGPVNDCVAVFDWLEQPCDFWTTDGLYVGGLFDGRDPHDGSDLSQPGSPPDPLYTWHGIRAKRIGANNFAEHSLLAADDFRTGGTVAQLADGSVLFFGQGANNNPCYRITGWDNWQRQRGTITIETPVNTAARADGSGLRAELYPQLELAGDAVKRVDEQLWFGIGKPWPAGTPASDFSVRWTGFIEPRFSEAYTLSIYARGDFTLWVDGQEVAWAPQDYPRDREIRKGHSVPLPLQAGTRVPIAIEYRATMSNPSFHLNWESLSQPVEHVPKTYLYPERE